VSKDLHFPRNKKIKCPVNTLLSIGCRCTGINTVQKTDERNYQDSSHYLYLLFGDDHFLIEPTKVSFLSINQLVLGRNPM
jgi:hypothetical protein